MGESEWSDWQKELPPELQKLNRIAFIPECLTTPERVSTHFVIVPDILAKQAWQMASMSPGD